MPLLLRLWTRQAACGRQPDELDKIVTGAWLTAASNLVLLAGIVTCTSARISPLWPLLSNVGFGIAFLYYWPTLLALISRVAPARTSATLMGLAMMTLFVANNLIGWLGQFYQEMSAVQFWTLHACIAASGGILALLLGRFLKRAFGLSLMDRSNEALPAPSRRAPER